MKKNKVFGFIKENSGILYSLALIIFIPALVFFNVFFVLSNFQEHIDNRLHLKATSIKEVFEIMAVDIVQDPEMLQKKVEDIGQIQDVTNIKIILPDQEEFKIAAAKNPEYIGKILPKDPVIIMAWYQERSFAQIREKNGERFWYVIDSFHNKDGEKIGLISLSLSLGQTDALVYQTVWKTYLILIITILFILVLVAQHTRLFGYVGLYKKMKELDEAKDSFIRMASHELQSPIINIRGYIEILEDEMSVNLTDDQKELFRRAKMSAKNLSDLSRDILDVSRFEQGRLEFTPERISPQEIIKEIVQEIEPRANQKGLKLFLELGKEENPCFLQLNPSRFRQILVNLITNSVKYTLKGEIRVRTRIDELREKYIIEVEDTGLGISAEAQKNLFQKFYRVKTKDTEAIQGTGLGLWLSKSFCETMGGEIFIESMAGVGTKITLKFPLN